MSEVVIAGAARTPVGSFNGSLAGISAAELGTVAIKESLRRANTSPEEVDEVIMGQVLTAATGMNPARQALLASGIPHDRTAYLVNQVCGSGLRSIAQGYQAIKAGDANILVTGGQESMSQAPHCIHLRDGKRMGDTKMVDTMLRDGLWDAFNGYHMGCTAENIAKQWQISREEQDQFALRSQQRAEKAQNAGKFVDEIAPVVIKTRKGSITVNRDEYPRGGVTAESLAELRPAFSKNGTVQLVTPQASMMGQRRLYL